MAKPVEQQTTAENQAEEILSPIVDETQPEKSSCCSSTTYCSATCCRKQKAEQAQQAKLAEQNVKAEEPLKAKTEEQQNKRSCHKTTIKAEAKPRLPKNVKPMHRGETKAADKTTN